MKDKEGNNLPFIPISLQHKCPVKASTATSNNTEMVALMEEATKIHSEYQAKMTKSAKSVAVASLEIKIRHKQLRTSLYDLIDTLALSKQIIAELEEGAPIETILLRSDATKYIVHCVFETATPQLLLLLEVDGAGLLAEYNNSQSYHHATYVALANANSDAAFLASIVTKMAADLPILTTNLWTTEDKKEKDRKINAALRKELEPKAIQKATEDVENAMDIEEETGKERLISEVEKLIEKRSVKQLAQMKKLMRKNYSDEDEEKNQSSKPGKSGQGLKNNSNASTSKKSGKKTKSNQKKDQPAAPRKQKRNGKANPPTNSNNPSKKQRNNRDSAVGSNGGGKKRSAARR